MQPGVGNPVAGPPAHTLPITDPGEAPHPGASHTNKGGGKLLLLEAGGGAL